MQLGKVGIREGEEGLLLDAARQVATRKAEGVKGGWAGRSGRSEEPGVGRV